MRNLLHGRNNGPKYPDLSLQSYHYAPQNHAIFNTFPHLLATIPLSPTDSQENTRQRNQLRLEHSFLHGRIMS